MQIKAGYKDIKIKDKFIIDLKNLNEEKTDSNEE